MKKNIKQTSSLILVLVWGVSLAAVAQDIFPPARPLQSNPKLTEPSIKLQVPSQKDFFGKNGAMISCGLVVSEMSYREASQSLSNLEIQVRLPQSGEMRVHPKSSDGLVFEGTRSARRQDKEDDGISEIQETITMQLSEEPSSLKDLSILSYVRTLKATVGKITTSITETCEDMKPYPTQPFVDPQFFPRLPLTRRGTFKFATDSISETKWGS